MKRTTTFTLTLTFISLTSGCATTDKVRTHAENPIKKAVSHAPKSSIKVQIGSDGSISIVSKKSPTSLKKHQSLISTDQVKYQSSVPTRSTQTKKRSTEWKSLPPQSWESWEKVTLPNVDRLGFDRASKIVFRKKNNGYEPLAIPATERLSYLGQIVGSRAESTYLAMNETVYIQAEDTLQVGETYGLTQEPTLLKSRRSDRIGYSYPILGSVKILGVRDHLFIGTIISAKDVISRGSSLIKMPPKIKELTPIPGQRSLQGIILIDHTFSTYSTAQHKEVFIDRGTDDGVKPGMVFRAYEHYDPANQKKITSSDFIIDADFLVISASETFSNALVISSQLPVLEYSSVVLLTDISDLLKNPGFSEKGPTHDELDELDRLDRQEGLGKEERKELRQLEQWQGNPRPPGDAPSGLETTPPPPPSPTDDAGPPPPPASGDAAPPPQGTPESPPTAEFAPTAPPPSGELQPPPAATGDMPPPPAGDSAPPPPPSDAGDMPPPPPAAAAPPPQMAPSLAPAAPAPAPPLAPGELPPPPAEPSSGDAPPPPLPLN